MRESPLFRAQLQQVNEHFPAKEVLNIRDVASYLGCSVNTAKKRFPFIQRSATNNGGCTKVQLAQELTRRMKSC